MELDRLLDQRVGADDQLGRAARHRLLRGALGRGRQATHEPGDVDVERLQPLRDLAEVLLGEDFGRRHQRDLEAAFDRPGRRQRGDHRLAAADVALHQPMHGARAAQVAFDLVPDAVLRRRQLERQRLAQLRRQFAGALQRVRTPLLARFAGGAQRDLLRQQFVELQALPGGIGALGQRLRIGSRRWMVQALDRGLQRGQPELSKQACRQDLDDVDVAQRAVDALAQPGLGHALGRRIDRRQRRRQRNAFVDGAHAWVNHFRPDQAAANGAERPHAPSDLELPQLRRIEMQEAQHQLAGAVAHRHPQLATAAVDDIGGDHFGLHLRLETRHQIGDRRHPRLVLVAQRQVQDEVPVARQAGACEFRRDGVARGRRAIVGGGLLAGRSRQLPGPRERGSLRPRTARLSAGWRHRRWSAPDRACPPSLS